VWKHSTLEVNFRQFHPIEWEHGPSLGKKIKMDNELYADPENALKRSLGSEGEGMNLLQAVYF
jgi:hypothetical protein